MRERPLRAATEIRGVESDWCDQSFCTSSGSLAIFTAICRASSLLKQISNGVGLASSLARPRPQPFCHDKTEPPG
jgi:hypothetical protein